MMRIIVKVVAWLIATLAVAAGAWYGRVVPFSDQWPMFEALRTTASIIFAVIGAWLAIIYPERLKLSIKGGNGSADGGSTGMGKLFTPVVNSTAILCVILIVGAAAPALKKVPFSFDISYMRGASYALLVALTLWQLWTVILTLVPANAVKEYVDHEDGNSRVLQDIASLTRKPTTTPNKAT